MSSQNYWADNLRILQWMISDVNVLHQILQVAVDDNYIRQNPSDRILSELKRSSCYEESHKRALTIQEQELFLNYLRKEGNPYHHWYPVFAVMVGTGMRVGEVTGLQLNSLVIPDDILEPEERKLFPYPSLELLLQDKVCEENL